MFICFINQSFIQLFLTYKSYKNNACYLGDGKKSLFVFFISAVAILYYLYFYPHTLDFTNLLTIQIINQYIIQTFYYKNIIQRLLNISLHYMHVCAPIIHSCITRYIFLHNEDVYTIICACIRIYVCKYKNKKQTIKTILIQITFSLHFFNHYIHARANNIFFYIYFINYRKKKQNKLTTYFFHSFSLRPYVHTFFL